MSNLLKNKLSFEALKKRSADIASEQLLSSISGGQMNACHDLREDPPERPCSYEGGA
jgi:hypothetical protein